MLPIYSQSTTNVVLSTLAPFGFHFSSKYACEDSFLFSLKKKWKKEEDTVCLFRRKPFESLLAVKQSIMLSQSRQMWTKQAMTAHAHTHTTMYNKPYLSVFKDTKVFTVNFSLMLNKNYLIFKLHMIAFWSVSFDLGVICEDVGWMTKLAKLQNILYIKQAIIHFEFKRLLPCKSKSYLFVQCVSLRTTWIL